MLKGRLEASAAIREFTAASKSTTRASVGAASCLAATDSQAIMAASEGCGLFMATKMPPQSRRTTRATLTKVL